MFSDLSQEFGVELTLCLKASYPLIFITTHEETRAFDIIGKVAASLKRRIIFPRIRGQSSAIQSVIQKSDDSDDIIVLDNIHRVLAERDILRSLVDVVTTNEKRCVVSIGPFFDIPPEIERLCVVLNLPLPGEIQLKKVLASVSHETGAILSEVDQSLLVRLAKGMTLDEAARAFRKSLIGWPNDISGAIESMLQEKQSALKKSRVLSQVEHHMGFEQVGGMDQLKEWLLVRKRAFTADAKAFGLPAPKGVLLMGVQGCGKSLAAKCIAGYWQMPLVRLDLSLLLGESFPEVAFSNAIHIVDAMAPLVLWVDELEKGFDDIHGTSSRVLGGLITWLQEKQSEVFVVATANRVSKLPPELPRKGRFDEVFFVDLPDCAEREAIFRIHLKDKKRNPDDFDVKTLAHKSDKFSGSEIEQVVISGLYQAFARGEEMNQNDLLFSISETVTLFEMYEGEIKDLREWARKRARAASTNRKKADMFQL